MKKLTSLFVILAMLNFMLVSCNKDEQATPDPGPAPELPPYESMVGNFSDFLENEDASKSIGVFSNYGYAAANIWVFNTILTITLFVPVSAFYQSFSAEAVFIGDATWQWSKSYNALGATYNSRLTGKVTSSNVEWDMYVGKEGVGGYDEFKWYEGTSDLDGNGGRWTLNHSNQFQEPLLQIDWEKTGDDIGSVRYTNIRELKDDRTSNEGNGSYVEAGLAEGDLNAYYTIYLTESEQTVLIEWSTTEYNGRVRNDSLSVPGWHCWDGNGDDEICTN